MKEVAMEEILSQQLTDEEAKQLQLGIQQALQQIQQLRERMKVDQDDIDQSRVRTEAMLAAGHCASVEVV